MIDLTTDHWKWLRALHIYLSMFGLVLLMFFAVTGFTLNHEEWFGLSELHTRKKEGVLSARLLAEPDKLGIVEKLRADFGATGAVDSFESQENSLLVVFKAPGRQAEASIDRATGRTEVTFESRGVIGRINDLHKGFNSGPGWSVVIDVAAILMFVSSVTGLLLWMSLPKRRRLGFAAVVLSVVLCAVVYLALVP